MDENPPFSQQAEPRAVTYDDVIVVDGTDVRVLSIKAKEVTRVDGRDRSWLDRKPQVWGIDDKGEAVLAAWSDGAWEVRFR